MLANIEASNRNEEEVQEEEEEEIEDDSAQVCSPGDAKSYFETRGEGMTVYGHPYRPFVLSCTMSIHSALNDEDNLEGKKKR